MHESLEGCFIGPYQFSGAHIDIIRVKSLHVEAVSRHAFQPKPVAVFGKIPIGKYLRIYGIWRSAHELIRSIISGQDEVLHDISFTCGTRKRLSEQRAA